MSNIVKCFWLLMILVPLNYAVAAENDFDNDGFLNSQDNCSQIANSNQRDTDCDGYGNVCDGDLDNDGFVSTPDLALFRKTLFSSLTASPQLYNAQADFDGDGVISTPDLAVFRTLLFKPLGPSGRTTKLTNHCPNPQAGRDQGVLISTVGLLDAAGSTDSDGDLLSYQWNLINKPSGSQAVIAEATKPRTQITIDKDGDYQISLKVSDGLGSRSDNLLLTTGNVPPFADAGRDQTVTVGHNAILDGTGSSDDDGDALTYEWQLLTKPLQSTSKLTDALTAQPFFSIDAPGAYQLQLKVNDGQTSSEPDQVVIRSDNSKPVANAGTDKTVQVNTNVALDGGSSSDIDQDAITYRWQLLYKPANSTVVLNNANTVKPSLTPDLPGEYIVQLTAVDSKQQSDADTVVITAQNAQVNHAPVITSSPTTAAVVGQSYAYKVNATDSDGDVLTFSLSSAPAGMTINSGSGQINWTPTSAQIGNQSVTVQVTDTKNASGVQSFSILVTNTSGQLVVPSLVGKSRKDAESALEQVRLELGTLTFQFSATVPDGQIISQSPIANTPTVVGTSVNLTISKGPNNGLPPNPETVATPADPTVASNVATSTDFLYKGTNAIQKLANGQPIANGTIEEKRAAVIRGKVLNKANQPLPGVVITIANHPELGQTLSRNDGQFDLAVNGGGYLTVNFNASGYLSAQRMIDVPWQDFALQDDVVLIPVDGKVTTVSLAPNQPMQVAQGNIVNDADGSRRTTALFPTGTQASITLADGSVRQLNSLNVRATEYTTGSNGPATMPGELPPTSGYTYATELSIDEAQVAGAKSVDFNQPVPFYVDNFLNFPVGIDVPVGYYDKDKAAWIPSDNGRIIKIVSITAGKAEIDTDGNGIADNNAALGITDAERERLATLYTAGKSLWRVPVKHFTPWDCNWPFGPPLDAIAALFDALFDALGDLFRCHNGTASGSIIGCETQTLGETIPVTGTPFSLNYRSDRMAGYQGGRALRISLRDKTLPPSLKRIEVEATVAGRKLVTSVLPSASKNVRLEWDGLNAYGQKEQGTHNVQIRVGYVYDAVYYQPAQFQQAFGRLSGTAIQGSRARQEVTLWSESSSKLNTWDAGQQTLGGWTLNVHHSYDPAGRKLYMGDGTIRAEDYKASVVSMDIGNGTKGFSGDNGSASSAAFNQPREIATGPDASVFISDSGNNRIRKVDPAGNVTTIAGTGVFGYSGDSGSATAARFRFPRGLVVGNDGSVYVADFLNNRIRKISPSGIISTIAGNGTKGYSGDGGPAIAASFDGVENIAVAPDGTLYLSDTGNNRVRVVGTDGIITTLAGNGTPGFSGDNGFAGNAQVNAPRGIAVNAEGVVYFADSGNARIRRIGTDGRITTFAGNGELGYSGDGGPALEASLGTLRGLTVTRDGSVCVSDFSNHRIRCVNADGNIGTMAGNGTDDTAPTAATFATQTPLDFPRSVAFAPDGGVYIARENANQIAHVRKPLAGFSGSDLAVSSEDGSLLYRFDQNGKHLATINTLTGATLLTFEYDAQGQLIRVKDANGNITTLERSATGVLQAIVGPYGQRTVVTLDGQGYIASVKNPAGESYSMNYTPSGLLTDFINPRGNRSSFTYDADGRFTKDTDAAGGFQTLALSEFAGGFDVTRATALGRSTLYRTENRPDGGQNRLRKYPDGTQEKRTIAKDGSTHTEQADGSIVDITEKTDPRFDSAQYPGRVEVNTGGLNLVATTEQTATLANPADPLSLTQLSQKLTLNGRVFNGVYTTANKTFTTTSAIGRQSKTIIDSLGRPVQSQVTGILPVDTTYDARGRLAAASQGSGLDQRTLTYAYNPAGYLASATDPLGRKVSFDYDLAGRVTKQILPDLREITFAYDQNSNLTSLTPPGRPGHLFRYTAVDLNDEYSPPDVGAGTNDTVYDYNLDHQLTKITRPDGQVLDYSYDNAGRLNRLTIPDGPFDFEYNGVTGKLDSLTAPDNGKLGYTYSGSLLTQVTWSGTTTGSVEYGYDDDLRLTSVGLNGANPITYQYDADSLLTKAGALNLTRNAQNGLLTGTTLGAVSDSITYNTFGEVATYEAKYNTSLLLKEEYTRDKLGRITQKKETLGIVSHTYDYSYDAAGRLIGVKKDGANLSSYTYDANGNRLSRTTSSGTVNGTYDNQDRLLTYAGASYSYTANGELATKTVGSAVTKYQYDVLGNLKHVDLPNGSKIDYVTDAQNRRIAKKVNGTTTQRFLWQGTLKPIAELDGSGNVVSRFVYGTSVNVPDYMIKGGVTYRIITDHLGSPRFVVEVVTNTVAQEMEFDEYGNVILDTNPGFQPFGFAGGQYDSITQLVRFGSRDYDSVLGRWSEKDPIGFAGHASNLMEYVFSDPINYADPNGRIVPVLIGIGAGIYAGLEFAGSVYDAYDTASTLLDPNVCTAGKVLAAGLFAAGVVLPGAGYSKADDIGGNLFRVVDDVELADIQKTGVFRTAPGQFEGKQFVDNLEDAQKLQQKFSDFFGGNQTIVKGHAPQSVLENASRIPFSDIPNGTAITVPEANLPSIKPIF